MRLHQALQHLSYLSQSSSPQPPKRPSLLRFLPLKWRSKLLKFLLLQFLTQPKRRWLWKLLLRALS